MHTLRLALILCLLTLACRAQLPGDNGLAGGNQASIKGSFLVSVDDSCTIFVNGKTVFQCGIGEKRSPALELKVGDRILVQLVNTGGPRHFFCLFASADGQTVISFKRTDFKIDPDMDVTDFTGLQFQTWPKYAKAQERLKPSTLPVQSNSDSMWGDLDRCIIAGYVTSSMISHKVQ